MHVSVWVDEGVCMYVCVCVCVYGGGFTRLMHVV